jgi:molybdopterin biosynthesis enzyme
MGGLAQSNALLVVPEDVGRVNEGEPVAVMVLERRLV